MGPHSIVIPATHENGAVRKLSTVYSFNYQGIAHAGARAVVFALASRLNCQSTILKHGYSFLALIMPFARL